MLDRCPCCFPSAAHRAGSRGGGQEEGRRQVEEGEEEEAPPDHIACLLCWTATARAKPTDEWAGGLCCCVYWG